MMSTVISQFDSVEQMLTELTPGYPVFCLREHLFKREVQQFLDNFPGTTLFAVKSNPHPAVLDFLFNAGISHFDVASIQEISLVKEQFPEATLYYMHPVKPSAHIGTAYGVYGVKHYVIDHKNELAKLRQQLSHDDICVVVRIETPESDASYALSEKFGAQPDTAVELLQAVHAGGLRAGIAFHVGSQCVSTKPYSMALELTKSILDSASVPINYLDVGGGFPVSYNIGPVPGIDDYFSVIKSGIATLGLPADCEIMCEPGRALVANGASLVTQVQLRKEDKLYLNDGIYGSISEARTAGFRFPVRLIRLDEDNAKTNREFMIFGPTCDSLDRLPSQLWLPEDVHEGDWIEFGRIGAYSNACSMRFNGFYAETFVGVNDDPFANM